jgi:ribonuclease HI
MESRLEYFCTKNQAE